MYLSDSLCPFGFMTSVTIDKMLGAIDSIATSAAYLLGKKLPATRPVARVNRCGGMGSSLLRKIMPVSGLCGRRLGASSSALRGFLTPFAASDAMPWDFCLELAVAGWGKE